MKRKHETPQNALADIALLLLIFFLITTQFSNEDGIKTTLPPLESKSVQQESKDIEIWLNAEDHIMLESKSVLLTSLSAEISIIMVDMNTDVRVNLKSHEQASYLAYVSVYDEIKQAYRQLHNAEAEAMFGKPFDMISAQEQGIIISKHPVRVFEGDLVQ
ncbi:MAG: biopolymer transporter ExbD [Bacteroidetes bacterium]|jgi:biopolymer transport protein ExbD|nr:biopolymer transporter ExbD [Bacteroidota bacterium]